MKKVLLYIAPVFLAFIAFLVIEVFFSKNSGKGALQVTSTPRSTVYLNGKAIGQTPLCKCEPQDMILTGEYTVRLVPKEGNFSPFEEKIKISKAVLTVVDRIFGNEASSEGNTISLSPLNDSKSLELLIISFPDNAQVLVDSNPSGNTPLLLKNLTESDHEIKIVKDGYKEKIIRIKTVMGYKLVAEAFLGINPNIVGNQQSPQASPSAGLQKIPSTTPSVSKSVSKVVILQTPTGFLRVREDAFLGGAEITRVYPNEVYDLLDEKNGWFQIKLKDGKTGWISSQYAQKQ